MNAAWEALADPTRREIVWRLAAGDLTAGQVAGAFAISRPGVSRHLRVLREAGLVTSTANGQHRVYALDPHALDDVEEWLAQTRVFWGQRLDALATEISRGKRGRGAAARPTTHAPTGDDPDERTPR